MQELSYISEKLKEFLSKRKIPMLISFIALVLIHGAKFFSVNVGVDTESAISMGNSFYDGWLSIGRQGLVLIKLIDGTMKLNPFFATIIMVLVLFLSYAFLFFIIEEVLEDAGLKTNSNIYNLIYVVGAILFFSQPIITEQMYFTLQCAEVAEGFLLTFIGVYAAYRWSKKSGWISLFIALIATVVAFSIYQSFVPVYIQLVIFILLIRSLADEKVKDQFKKGLMMAVAFLIAFVINFVTSKIFFYGSDYVSSQSKWGSESFSTIVHDIVSHIYHLQKGDGIYYFVFYSVLVIALLISLVSTLKKKTPSQKIWQIFMIILTIASPYFLTIITGCAPVARSQFNLPLAELYIFVYCYIIFTQEINKKTFGDLMACVVIIAAVIGCWQQVNVTERLYYSDAVRYQQDEAFGYELISEIDDMATGEEEPTIIILGNREERLNPSCIQGEVMGHSLFNWDVDVEPKYYYSTHRMVGFLNTLGADYKAPSMEKFSQLQQEFDSCKDEIFQTDNPSQRVGKWNDIYVVKIN